MAEDLGTEIKIGADASGVEAGVNQAKRSIASLGKSAADAGAQGGKGLEKLGEGSEKSAKKIEQETRKAANSLQRLIAAAEAGGTANRQYQESLLRMRGADVNALKPLLDQLDAARAKTVALDRAQDGLGKSLGTLGTAASFAKGQMLALASSISFASMAAFVKNINDGVDALNDIKDATGASIENISALENVGKRTGASFETVGSVLVKFNKVLSEATPKSDISIALKAIGLEADALKKIDPAEALRQTAVALAGYADDANKARLIQELFGKSVKEAAPFLTDLAEQTELVGTVTARQAEEAEKLNKQYFELQTKAQDLSRELVAGMVPGLQQITEAMTKGAKEGGALLAVWRGLREFGSIAFGTDKLGTATGDAKRAAEEIKRLNGLMNSPLAVLERDPDKLTDQGKMAQRRVDTLRLKIEGLMKVAQAASEQVKELVNGPPPEEAAPAKPTVKPGPSAAEQAAAAAAAKKAADERKKELEDRAKLLAELSGLSGSFAKEWGELQKAFKEGDLNVEQMDAAVAKLLAKQPFMIEGNKKEAKTLEDLTKERQAAADALNKEYEGVEKYLKAQDDLATQTIRSIEDRIAALDLEDEAASLAAATNISLAEAINRVRVARLREKRDGPTGVYEGSEEYDRLTNEIDGLNREADRLNRNDRNDRARDTTRKAKQDFDRYVEDTSRGLGDAIETAIFDGSKAGGEKMREVLQEALLRKPLRMVIDATMNQITGGLLNMLGMGGGGAAGGSPLSSLFSLGSTAYQASQGQGILGSAWQGISSMFGGGAATSSGLSSLAATNVGSFGGVGSGVIGQGGAYTATAAPGAGGMGALGAAGFWAAVAYAIGNAIGVNRKKELVGTGLTGTLGGADLTPWENFRKPGTVLMGPDYTRVNPLELYEDYRKRDLEYVKTLKENGGSGTLNGSPYGNDFAATAAMGNSEYQDNIREIAASSKRQSDEIQKGYAAVRKSAVDMANDLGLAGDKLKDFTVALDPEDLNFKDLNAEQISEKIAKVFGDAGKDMAQQVLGTWVTETVDVVNSTLISQLTDTTDQLYDVQVDSVTRTRYVASEYAKAGETAFETLTRLSTSFSTLNEAADALGFGIQKGSLALADFADDFIEAFGGLEKFTASTSAFLQNYYTDGERREYLIRSGVRQAEKLGIKGLTEDNLRNGSREQLRDFVNTAASNPELYADALDLANYLSPIFGAFEEQAPVVQEVANVVDELTQSYQNAIKSLTGDRDSLAVEVLRAQGDEVGAKALERSQYLAQFAGLDAARLKEIETLYDGNVATRKYIQGIKDAAQAQLDALAKLRTDSLALIDTAAGKTDAALAAYERAADKERERLQGTIDSVKAVFQAAEDGAKSFFGEVEAVAKFQGAEGRDFISQALASAQAGGGLPDGKDLADAIAAVGKDFSATQFTSQAEADFQRLVVANELKGLQDISDNQLTEAEKQLEALNDQVEFARDQVNLLRGIDSSLKDLPTALANLINAYNDESRTRTNVAAKAIIGTGSAVYDKTSSTGLTSSGAFFDAADMAAAAQAVIAANPGASGKNSVLDALEGKGYTMPQYNEIFGLPPGTLEAEAKALGRPIFHNGTTYVPETGFALLQQGEAVIPAAFNPFNGGAMGGNARSESLMLALIERVKSLEATVQAGNEHASTTAGVLKGAQNGSALNTTQLTF